MKRELETKDNGGEETCRFFSAFSGVNGVSEAAMKAIFAEL